MSTFRDNLEHQIKKQINEREITPSRDLWSEIELQTKNEPKKYHMSWILAAACIVLAFTLGFVLFFNSKKENIQKPQIVNIKPEAPQEKAAENLNKPQPVLAVKKQNVTQQDVEVPVKIQKEVTPEKVLAKQTPKAIRKEALPVIVPEIPQIPADKIMAQTDSSKAPVKKKKYVDPSTLLFSVEHKDVIEKTKESNVATVDLNGK